MQILGVLVDSKLYMNPQCTLAAMMGNCVLSCFSKIIDNILQHIKGCDNEALFSTELRRTAVIEAGWHLWTSSSATPCSEQI